MNKIKKYHKLFFMKCLKNRNCANNLITNGLSLTLTTDDGLLLQNKLLQTNLFIGDGDSPK